MTSYILRIYREEENNPRHFVGTIEEAGEGGKKAFTSLDELWTILNPAGMRSSVTCKDLQKKHERSSERRR